MNTGTIYKYWIKLLGIILFKLYRINTADRKKAKIYDQFYPIFSTSVQGENFRLSCPNIKVFKRCESFIRKEPETIDWIAGFSAGEIFFDIGANIGLYSLLAARKGLNVFSFEPESQNFGVMIINMHLNSASSCMTALNIAISDRNTLDYLYMPVFSTGTAFNQFGKKTATGVQPNQNGFKQRVISYTVDAVIENYSKSIPTHIKIDVDGIQSKIIAGAAKTIESPQVQSMLIEMDSTLDADLKAIDWILSKGFKISSRCPKADSGVFNYIFRR